MVDSTYCHKIIAEIQNKALIMMVKVTHLKLKTQKCVKKPEVHIFNQQGEIRPEN